MFLNMTGNIFLQGSLQTFFAHVLSSGGLEGEQETNLKKISLITLNISTSEGFTFLTFMMCLTIQVLFQSVARPGKSMEGKIMT